MIDSLIFQPVMNPYVIGFIILMLTVLCVTSLAKTTTTERGTRSAWLRRLGVVLLLGVLLIRPGFGQMEDTPIYTNQFDIFFVVDTTNSIIAEDWGEDREPRLDAIKQDVKQIVQTYNGARYSLIVFDSSASIQTPLTHDANSVMSGVNVLTPEVSKYSKGSSLSEPVNLLAQIFEENKTLNPDRNLIMFYFSDGEQTSNNPVESFTPLQGFISQGMVLGYGTTQGGKMKHNNGHLIVSGQPDYVMDTTKNPPVEALSVFDGATLTVIAEELGITYVHRSGDVSLVLPELETQIITSVDSTEMVVTADFTWMLVLPVVVLLSLELSYLLIRLKALPLKPAKQVTYG